ncbi:hypothetical protein F4818DRAFT_451231 [Hypoxylon cercidicola]|nr:hypothetical protein F4818DRAFT_451231 [Hypoxylon cercidicola]
MGQDDKMSPQQKAVAATVAAEPDDHCAGHKRECPFQDRPKLRWAFLIGLVVLVAAVLVAGVVFSVYYDSLYYSSGAFLVKQKAYDDGVDARAEAAAPGGAATGGDVCGEKMDSCRAYNQPNICCPAGMVCHGTSFSPSGVYCCAPGSACAATESDPPRCSGAARPCGARLGGGCCVPGTQCAAAGCLKTYRAAPGFAPSLLSGTQKPTPTRTSAGAAGSATQGAVTVTTPKIGETAAQTSGGGGGGGVGGKGGFGFTSYPALELLLLGCALAVSCVMALGG